MWVEKGSLLLAPMAGVTDKVYREICTRFGADGTVTEMVSAKGYLLTPREREEVVQLRETSPGERCALQIFGSDADFMGRAAERLCEDRFFALDVNMGCPAPKIVSGGDGSAMLRDLPNAERVLRAVVRNAALPVTVKMRMGWDEASVNYLDAGKMAQDCGAAAVTLHARTRSEMYSGRAHWEAIAELSARLSIPVIGNGDVESAQDAQEMLRQTGCYAVMVGRGAMGNPWIFRDWQRARQGLPPAAPSPRERIETAHAHARALVAHKGEYIGLREMRKHAAWYLKGLRGSAQVRVRVNLAQSLGELSDILQAYLADLEREEAPAAPHSPE
ncbi:MAG TPA: tRNA dihydrouridine synthase DusB [Candidatus Spyradocola merdavium]|nr:tRNA dihydrouridine synthase DusB [Candidatus Spyradocola merdavium]